MGKTQSLQSAASSVQPVRRIGDGFARQAFYTDAMTMTVLIIGGYGFFGRRLCELLKDEAGLSLIIAGRNAERAARHCLAFAMETVQCSPLKLDRTQDLSAQIPVRPDLIIDMSGPFQAYGDAPYRVLDYALETGADYIDIADSADFVAGIAAYDARAKAAGIFALSGLSTYPVLSAAALTHLQAGMGPITHAATGIAPSPKTGMGRSVIDAIASYAGRPITVWREGRHQTHHGLTETRKRTIAVPGARPMRPRLFSNVDAPDSCALPDVFPQLTSLWSGAGPAPRPLHYLLIWLSRLTRYRLFPGLKWMSGIMAKTQRLLAIGEARGGLFAEASDGHALRSWHMIADGDSGPYTPVIPAAIIIKKILRAERPISGARAGTLAVTLREFETEFAPLGIISGTREDSAVIPHLYAEILGEAYARLPGPIQDLHRIEARRVFTGTADISRGRNPLGRMVAALFRFPKPGKAVPITVTLDRKGAKEYWTRNFGGRVMKSTQEAGTGARTHLIVERFGPFAVGLAVIATPDHLSLQAMNWRFLGLPLPTSLVPRGDIFETVQDGVFQFDVEIKAPLFGRMVHYRGHLKPQTRPLKTVDARA